MFGKDSNGGVSLTVLFGLFGVLAPFASIYIATFMGESDIAMFNSSMLMFLSVLLMVFLIINFFQLTIIKKRSIRKKLDVNA